MSLLETNPTAVNGDLAIAIQSLAEANSFEDIQQLLHQSARRLTNAHGIALVMRDGDFCHYVDEDAVGPLWKGQKFPMAACISGWSMLKRQTVCIPDISKDRRIPYDLYERTFVQSLVMTPVGLNPPVSALGAYWGHVYTAQPNEVSTLQSLAHAVGEAILRVRGNVQEAARPALAAQKASAADVQPG